MTTASDTLGMYVWITPYANDLEQPVAEGEGIQNGRWQKERDESGPPGAQGSSRTRGWVHSTPLVQRPNWPLSAQGLQGETPAGSCWASHERDLEVPRNSYPLARPLTTGRYGANGSVPSSSHPWGPF